MRKPLLIITLLGIFFLLNSWYGAADAGMRATKITEEKILAIINSADAAITRGDVKGMTEHMASDIVVTVHIPGPEGTQVITMNLRQYEQFFEETMKAVTDYIYTRKDTQIVIAPGGDTATVKSTVLERTTIDGRVITSITEETAVFELRQGRILVTSLEGVILSLEVAEEKTLTL